MQAVNRNFRPLEKAAKLASKASLISPAWIDWNLPAIVNLRSKEDKDCPLNSHPNEGTFK
jgi:hypothetical protein